VPDGLQEKLNEGAFVQAKVDLLIAKADLDAIENDQYRLDSAHKGWEQANKAKIRSRPTVSSKRWTSSVEAWTAISTEPRGTAAIGRALDLISSDRSSNSATSTDGRTHAADRRCLGEREEALRQPCWIVDVRGVAEPGRLLDDRVLGQMASEVGERARREKTFGLAPQQENRHLQCAQAARRGQVVESRRAHDVADGSALHDVS
jgi:hypothetical protein